MGKAKPPKVKPQEEKRNGARRRAAGGEMGTDGSGERGVR